MSQVLLRRAAGASFPTQAALWTPLNMATLPQIYLHAQESAVTDVSGACSAISNLGAMGVNGDFSQSTAGRRPTIIAAEINGKRILRFDGTDDVLVGSSSQQLNIFSGVSAAWSFVVYKKRGTDASPITRRLLHATNNATGVPRFCAHIGSNAAGGQNKQQIFARRLDAEGTSNMVGTAMSSGAYAMALHAVDYSTRVGRIYLNGELDAEVAALTTTAGPTSSTAAADPLAVGARSDGVIPCDIDLAAIIIGNVYPVAGEIDELFGWAAHEFGLAASLQAGHPYKSSPPIA